MSGPAPQGGRADSPRYLVSVAGTEILVTSPKGSERLVGLGLAVTIGGKKWVLEPENWRLDGEDLVTAVALGRVRYELRLAARRGLPCVRLLVNVQYLEETEVQHEELSLTFEELAELSVLGRDMIQHGVDKPSGQYLVDRWTPLEVGVSSGEEGITLSRVQGFPSAVVERTGHGATIRLELDDSGNHPFRPYARCTDSQFTPPPYLDLGATRRKPGDTVSHEVDIWLGRVNLLRPQRLPEGRRAAIVFTSHADRSSVPSTRALLFGHSREDHPDFGRRGIVANGLGMTFTAWAKAARHASLADTIFWELLNRAAKAGIEIGVHSASPGPETKTELTSLLGIYQQFEPVTWIDHQPVDNCEAINNAAGLLDQASAYHVLPLLRQLGFEFLWAIPDEVPPGGINLLGPERPDYRPAWFFPNPRLTVGDWRPWMFRTIWRFLKVRYFLRLFGKKKLERLVAERGVQIAHGYFDSYQLEGRLADRSLLRADSGGGLAIRDEVEALFRRLARRQEKREIWVTGMRELGRYLVGLDRTTLDYQVDGSVDIRTETDIKGWSVAIPLPGVTVLANDESLPSSTNDEGETVSWLDLEQGKVYRLRFERDGKPVQLVSAANVRLELR